MGSVTFFHLLVKDAPVVKGLLHEIFNELIILCSFLFLQDALSQNRVLDRVVMLYDQIRALRWGVLFRGSPCQMVGMNNLHVYRAQMD